MRGRKNMYAVAAVPMIAPIQKAIQTFWRDWAKIASVISVFAGMDICDVPTKMDAPSAATVPDPTAVTTAAATNCTYLRI